MLYISRFVSTDKFGVVDTDDGVEEVIDIEQLVRTCYIMDIDILGVVDSNGPLPVSKVHPHQLEGTLTKLQVKTLMLQGVDIKIYNNMVTSVRLLESCVGGVTIRLSDFAHTLGDRILVGNSYCVDTKLTLVFDDTLSFSPNSVWIGKDLCYPQTSTGRFGVVLDFSELSDDEVVWNLYRTLYDDCSCSMYPITASVKDSPERFALMPTMLAAYRSLEWRDLKDRVIRRGSFAVR